MFQQGTHRCLCTHQGVQVAGELHLRAAVRSCASAFRSSPHEMPLGLDTMHSALKNTQLLLVILAPFKPGTMLISCFAQSSMPTVCMGDIVPLDNNQTGFLSWDLLSWNQSLASFPAQRSDFTCLTSVTDCSTSKLLSVLRLRCINLA